LAWIKICQKKIVTLAGGCESPAGLSVYKCIDDRGWNKGNICSTGVQILYYSSTIQITKWAKKSLTKLSN
jgi:hypothetical protein